VAQKEDAGMVTIRRRGLLSGIAATALAGGSAQAQPAGFPTGPVTVVFPFAAGGKGDLVARIVVERAQREFGRPMVVENRSGASGVIGAQMVARARPDGYTLLFMSTTHTVLPNLQQTPYDLLQDFGPVFGLFETPMVFVVNAASDLRSFDDVAAAGKATREGLNYSSGGAGSNGHLISINLLRRLGAAGTHIPFRGSNFAAEALRAGQVDIICVTVGDVVEQVKTGSLRALAVAHRHRSTELPDVPTMAELGFEGFVAPSINAFVAPSATPAPVLDRLHAGLATMTQDPTVQDRLKRIGVETNAMTRAQLGTFLREEFERWRRVVQENAIRIAE
jgi:tripartite-type tricarboxylate transporter receptor subunit TctC